ncbi:MAG TPA: helix-turn-helix transcriptional regulator, partial [Dehalococcoidia bacterium]
MARRGRPKHPDILTPREWDVLALLREGCTNDEIASRLGISVSTARYHVSEILGKLAMTSREEAARWQPDAASTPGRQFVLAAPFAFLRRLGGLGAGARVAAGGVLAVAAVGVGLLAWGVMQSSGSASGRSA